MSLRTFGALFVLAALMFVGCKSKETTSAIIHNQTGRYDLAIETAKEALAKDPADAEAHFHLAIAYSNLDSVGLAYQHFKKSAELDEKKMSMVEDNIQSNYARHYNRGLNLVRDQDFQMAANEFKLATESDPREGAAYHQLGKAYAELGDAGDAMAYDKAITAFDRVLELSTPADKHYIDALALAGEVLAKTGRPEDARSRFNRLVEEDPTSYGVIEKIGYDLLNEQNWAGAAIFLELAADARSRIDAESFDLLYNIGVAHFQLRKDNPEALKTSVGFFQRALDIKPDEPTTILNIVRAYVVMEDWTQAVTWGEKYINLKAEDAQGWMLLARSYNGLGDKEKATHCTTRYEQLRAGK